MKGESLMKALKSRSVANWLVVVMIAVMTFVAFGPMVITDYNDSRYEDALKVLEKPFVVK